MKNMFKKCIFNTFGLLVLVYYTWFFGYNWSMWKTSWVLGIVWGSSLLVSFVVLAMLYKYRNKLDWRFKVANRLKKAQKESMITRATLVLLKKHPEIRQKLIL
jgi:hypothetical protein